MPGYFKYAIISLNGMIWTFAKDLQVHSERFCRIDLEIVFHSKTNKEMIF